MGSSLLEFQSVGGHGCNREAKVGDNVVGCAKMGCPDCEARRAVIQMMEAGVGSFEKARFVHWPGTTTEVVDEFTWEPPLSSQYAPERNCDDLASVLVWLRTLDPTG